MTLLGSASSSPLSFTSGRPLSLLPHKQRYGSRLVGLHRATRQPIGHNQMRRHFPCPLVTSLAVSEPVRAVFVLFKISSGHQFPAAFKRNARLPTARCPTSGSWRKLSVCDARKTTWNRRARWPVSDAPEGTEDGLVCGRSSPTRLGCLQNQENHVAYLIFFLPFLRNKVRGLGKMVHDHWTTFSWNIRKQRTVTRNTNTVLANN